MARRELLKSLCAQRAVDRAMCRPTSYNRRQTYQKYLSILSAQPMIHLTRVLFAASLLLLCACNKGGDPSVNSFSMTINGTPVSDRIVFVKNPDKTLNFLLRRYAAGGILELELNFNYIPQQAGRYPLYREINDSAGAPFIRPNAQLFTLKDGKEICGGWAVIEADSATNNITVDANKDSKEFSGSFAVSFLKLNDCPEKGYPDTLRITAGAFRFTP